MFEIAKTSSGYARTPITLITFNGSNGAYPGTGLVADTNGDLFGTTLQGGASNDGTVFEIAYDPTTSSYSSTPTTLTTFNSENGGWPYGSLIADAQGDLFGTTFQGGASNDGTVFELAYDPSTGNYAAAPATLVTFDNNNGAAPETSLIANPNGDLFGTTSLGGTNGFGTVFELNVNGPSEQFEGTPGTPNCVGKSISTLAQNYGGVAHAAVSLGYASVSGLQSAVASYCSN